MHIPKGASQTCALLTFDDALRCPQHDDYDAARWLYVPPYYTEYRYILGTRGENPLICIGINPSTAQPGDLDNTLKSVERIALGNGYDSFTMFNVYPQRATDPNAMDTAFNRALHEQNMAAFRYVLGQYAPGNRPAVWAAVVPFFLAVCRYKIFFSFFKILFDLLHCYFVFDDPFATTFIEIISIIKIPVRCISFKCNDFSVLRNNHTASLSIKKIFKQHTT